MFLPPVLFFSVFSETIDAISAWKMASVDSFVLNLSSNNALCSFSGVRMQTEENTKPDIIEILLCAVGCDFQQSFSSFTPPSPWDLSSQSLRDAAASDHSRFLWSVISPLRLNGIVAMWGFSLCSCNFRRNEPANSYFIRPEANGEKERSHFGPCWSSPPSSPLPPTPVLIFFSPPVSIFSPPETWLRLGVHLSRDRCAISPLA